MWKIHLFRDYADNQLQKVSASQPKVSQSMKYLWIRMYR